MSTTWMTIRGVELAKVGDWPVYRGDGQITKEDLADIVEAAKDPEVLAALDGGPLGWLGHVDSPEAAQVRQSEPAVSRQTNLRLSADGETLLGDIEDVPENVARLYPRRSVELRRNITNSAGRTYKRVMTGLAHLGRVRGAIGGMADLSALIDGRSTPTFAAMFGGAEATLMAVPGDESETEPGDESGALSGDPADRTVAGMPTKPKPKPGDDAAEKPVDEKPDVERTDGEPAVDDEDVETPGEGADADETTEAASGPETVTITKAAYYGLVGRLDSLEKKDKKRGETDRVTERDSLIAAAVKDTLLAPADRDDTVKFANRHGNDALRDMLGRLKPGAVPVDEIGTSDDGTGDDAFAGLDPNEPLPDHLSIVRRRKPNRKGTR